MVRSLPVIPIRDAVHFPRLINTLLVAREPSLRAIQESVKTDHLVLVLSQRDMSVDDPGAQDLRAIGIVSEVLQTTPLPDGKFRVALRGLYRARAKHVSTKRGTYFSEHERLEEEEDSGVEIDALCRTAVEAFMGVVEKNERIPPESIESVVHADCSGLLADTIAHHLPLKTLEKQELLEELRGRVRLERALGFLRVEEEVLAAKSRIQESVDRQLGEIQKEYVLREQLKHIQKELKELDGSSGEIDGLRCASAISDMPAELQERYQSELTRLESASFGSPESLVIRNYLETLVALPWNRRTTEQVDVGRAKKLLNERHFGLEAVKERVLDFLAVHQLGGRSVGSILCFVGPPGVGKTSIGRSIAEAMGRNFVRIALGGVRDEGEIRGHRRTYVGSMPGRLIQGLKNCGSRNPVILLDEIDKLGQNPTGDPMSALLEALDPEQNNKFTDHYVDAPFDLSDVIFIATANLLDVVPGAVRDRMEIIQFSAYTDEEKLEIAKRFLLPRQKAYSGLRPTQLVVEDAAITTMIRRYTREAGVRDLERQLATLGRKAARAIAEGCAEEICICPDSLAASLGSPKYQGSDSSRNPQPGLAWGLVVSQAGGDVIPIEASLLPRSGSRNDIRLTGSLGDVMKESALAAVTYLQTHLGTPFEREVHIHVPEAGVPKDGPSAGLAILLALASAYSDQPLRQGVAVTGELTLLGRVLPVGGVRDKILAAIRSEFKEVILPADNKSDLDDLPASSQTRIILHLVRTAEEALRLALLDKSPE